MSRDNYYYFKPYSANSLQALKFADAGYNGGNGGVDKERRACQIKSGCDPAYWDNHVEHLCLKSRVPKKGISRSACDINRHHVVDVFDVRTNKYKPSFEKAKTEPTKLTVEQKSLWSRFIDKYFK
jgi:hypothetical protein